MKNQWENIVTHGFLMFYTIFIKKKSGTNELSSKTLDKRLLSDKEILWEAQIDKTCKSANSLFAESRFTYIYDFVIEQM